MSRVGSAAARRNTASLLDTTMEIYHDDDIGAAVDNNSLRHRSSAKALATPSPRTDSENNQHEHDDDDDDNADNNNNNNNAENDEDDVFLFDAPAYYDLKNPALEARYVNNADGYFTPEYKPHRKAAVAATVAPPPQLAPAPAATVVGTPRRANTHAPPSAVAGPPVATPAFNRFDQPQQQLVTAAPHSNQEDAMQQYREPQTADDDDDADDDDAMSSDAAALETSEDMHVDEQLASSRSRLYDDKDESFEEVFAHYASSSSASSPRHSIAHLLAEPSLSLPPVSARDVDMAAPRSTGSAGAFSSTSTLLQPTQAFLRRVHTEHAMRAQSQLEGAPLEDKPLRLTKPRSPTLRTSQKAAEHAYRDANDPSRLSYTSRELLQIQEERLRVQLERMKIREFHARTKAQRPPANVHQRSTKHLTIPMSPHLEVDHRARRGHAASDDGSGSETTQQQVPALIRPETLMSRDFALPLPPTTHSSHDVMKPAPPHLHTADRASRRAVHHDDAPAEKPAAPDYSQMRVGGRTQPLTPQLETTRRAQTHRRPIDVVDKDAVELARKFHAQPVSRAVLAPRAAPATAVRVEKPPLTQPVSPKLTTSARVASRQSASERAAAAIADLERRRKEREQQRQRARAPPASATSAVPRGPTIPETPDLKSIRLHRQYQENLRRRVEAEEEALRKQREFRAQPMRVSATPPRFEGSSKPLTEVVPFALPGEQYHQRARERLEQKKREEEARLAAQSHFKAMPMPVFDASGDANGSSTGTGSARPLTKFAAPELASDRRAAERAAFDAAERERREREDAYRRQLEDEARQRQEEELRALRREKLTFHARPVPESRAFTVKPSDKPLTEPQSPALHYHPHAHQHRSGASAS